jgi:hypothetical protein
VNASEDDPPAIGHPPPPFIDQGEVAHKHAAWVLAQYRSTGMQSLRSDGALTNLGSRGRRGGFVLAGEQLRG